MKVLTLNHTQLRHACSALAEQVKSSGFTPDVIVAVPSGGVPVAELVAEFLDTPCMMCQIETHRPSSRVKKKSTPLAKFLRTLPYWLLNIIRIAESYLISKKHAATHRMATPYISQECSARMGNPGCKILVVDDAVDSGATLHCVITHIADRFPNAVIRSAAITSTTTSPLASPDYALFRNRTLIRFPWSIDYKN